LRNVIKTAGSPYRLADMAGRGTEEKHSGFFKSMPSMDRKKQLLGGFSGRSCAKEGERGSMHEK